MINRKNYLMRVFALLLLATSSCFFGSCAVSTQNMVGPKEGAKVGSFVEIAKSGESNYQIVLPINATACERFAAGEIRKYLKEMSGISLPIVNGVKCPGIYIGKTEIGLTNSKNRCLQKKDEEAFLMETDGDKVILIGNCDRSTLYAAYTFLEKLGCLWMAPGVDRIPRKSEIVIKPFWRIEEPTLKYRCLRFACVPCKNKWQEQCLDWAVKLKLNVYVPTKISADSMPVERICTPPPDYVVKRGGFRAVNICHLAGLALTKKIAKEHPDWMAEVKGSRIYHGRHWWPQPCTTNPAVIEFFCKLATTYFASHPAVQTFPLTQSDGTSFCQCPDCTALDKGIEWDRGLPSITERWITFVNKVGQKVRIQYPDKKLYFVAYHQTVRPPDPNQIKPAENIMVELVHSNPNYFCAVHKIADKKCRKNLKFLDALKKWVKISKGGVYVYDYCPHSLFRQLPYFAYKKFFADIKLMKEIGVIGYELQSDPKIFGGYTINYYATCKAMWNPFLDPDAVMNPYFKSMYMESAEFVKNYCEFIENSRDGCPRHSSKNSMLPYFNSAMLSEAETYINKAVNSASTPLCRFRVGILRDEFLYAKWRQQGLDAFEKYKKSGQINDLKDAVASLRKIHDLYLEIRKDPARRNYGICWGRVDHGSEGKGITSLLTPWEYALKNAKLTIPAKPGIKVGVYFAGYGTPEIIAALSKVNGLNPFSIPDLKSETLCKCDVVIVPNTVHKSMFFNIESKNIKKWVENGGQVILLHDSVGYRKHNKIFPEIGQGKSHPRRKTVKVTKKHPLTQGLKPGETVFHDYYDHVVINPGELGEVIVSDEQNEPVVVVGKIGKGTVVLNGMLTGIGSNQVGILNVAREPSGGELAILADSVKWLASNSTPISRKNDLGIITGEKFSWKPGQYLRKPVSIYNFTAKETGLKPEWLSMDIFLSGNKSKRDSYKRIFIPRGHGIAFSPEMFKGMTDYVRNGGLLITNYSLLLIDSNGDYQWERNKDKTFSSANGGFELVGCYGHSCFEIDKIKAVKSCPLTEGLTINKWIELGVKFGGSKVKNRSAVAVVVSNGEKENAVQPCLTYKRTGRGACIYIVPVAGGKGLKEKHFTMLMKNIFSNKTLYWLTPDDRQ